MFVTFFFRIIIIIIRQTRDDIYITVWLTLSHGMWFLFGKKEIWQNDPMEIYCGIGLLGW
jgi:hypothetical protein